MARVRYGARTEAEMAAARTPVAKLPDIWSTRVVAKKLGEVAFEREGLVVRASLARHGIAFVEVRGAVNGPLPLPEPSRKTDFTFKFLPAVDGWGFDGDPVLVHCLCNEKVRRLERVTGEVVLRESMYDPVADLPVLRLVDITIGEKTSDRRGKVVERVSAQALLPYIHQRYDDPRQILDAPPAGSV
ncbi:acetoacetate decarboxylase family protein [Streptomyces sp. NPDC002092]